MTTTTPALPRYLLRSDLVEFYGLSRGGIDGYQRRGLLPQPDAVCSTGMLWSQKTLEDARRDPDPSLAAVVPVDELGHAELSAVSAYICPADSGHHVGWTSPSVIGLVASGLSSWYSVQACARYDGLAAYETSAAGAPAVQAALDTARRYRSRDYRMTVFLLSPTPLATGPVRVSAVAKTAGLQRGRLLRRDGDRVGAEGNWLTLPSRSTTPPLMLDEYTLPILDQAFPA